MKFRPRFSLRMLFVVLTVLAVWLGWQMSIVRERQRMLKALEAASGSEWNPYRFSNWSVGSPQNPPRVPWYRAILGDKPISEICLPPTMTPDDLNSFKQLFPEAMVGRHEPKPEIVPPMPPEQLEASVREMLKPDNSAPTSAMPRNPFAE